MTTRLARIEKLIAIALLDDEDVATLIDERVYIDTPHQPTEPYVRVNRIGGRVLDGPYWAEPVLVQIDVFGGGRPENWLVAETVRSVIAHLEGLYPDDSDRTSWHAVHPPRVSGITETTTEQGTRHARFDFTVLTHPTDPPPYVDDGS